MSSPLGPNVNVIDHPLVQHKLTRLREKERSTNSFRRLLSEISILLAYEVTRDLPLTYETIETPLATMQSPVLDGKKVVLINILRAGTGMVEGPQPGAGPGGVDVPGSAAPAAARGRDPDARRASAGAEGSLAGSASARS